jgi:hypothetical protein
MRECVRVCVVGVSVVVERTHSGKFKNDDKFFVFL